MSLITGASKSSAVSIRVAAMADVDALVALHYRVFNAATHHALELGTDFMRAVYRWFCSTDRGFVVVAEQNNQIVGLCAVNGGSYFMVFRENIGFLIRALLRRPALIFRTLNFERLHALWKSRRFGSSRPNPRSGTGQIAFLAVAPEARTTGAGIILLQHAALECRKKGWQEMVTAVHRTNTAIIRLYKILGFEDYPALNTTNLAGLRLKKLTHEAAFPTGGAGIRPAG
ncbi:MAG TPA: GNAT family N-acetyltransferase [Candidatus Paceibacterota bacterium]|nr:GNAT family N-acetyltransferase [Candidatus Paceibacterota bacterium]HSA01673.1 GNAT family N-acetyltransferase [Candidatus Paceibacterota bacterium]